MGEAREPSTLSDSEDHKAQTYFRILPIQMVIKDRVRFWFARATDLH